MASVSVVVEPDTLDPDCYAICLKPKAVEAISFVGLTRGVDQGVEVQRLEFDAWEEQLPSVLQSLCFDALDRFSVKSIVMAHRTGSVEPQEPIVCIHVGSVHRAEGFEACSWLISELKNQAPLWKKEVRADGEVWKGGLG